MSKFDSCVCRVIKLGLLKKQNKKKTTKINDK